MNTDRFKLPIEIWCSDEHHLGDLIQSLNEIFLSENAKYGGYGYSVKIDDGTLKKIKKHLKGEIK